MSKIINRIFLYGKIFLLLMAFIITFYFSLLKMDFYNESIMSSIMLFLPFLLVSIVIIVGLFFSYGNDNIFYNLVCVLVLLAIIIIDYRAILDQNIVSTFGTDYNFSYFSNQILYIKIMLYLTFLGNLLLLCWEKRKKNKIHS